MLMLAENVFPPIPSEIIMPLAGFTAARGELHIVGVVVAGSVGTLLGALIWYYIGLRPRHHAAQDPGPKARPVADAG
ncbi:MAG: hypothetical protein H0T52_03030 [Lautropia sp.]|nr:hypothetical protein [Lautropia sp.]